MTTSLDHIALRGLQVRLREFRLDDVDSAFTVVGDDRVTQTLSFDSRTRAQTRDLLAGAIERARQRPRSEFYLAVALPDEDVLVGFVRLGLSGVRAAKLGFAIAANHWGRGYATDAAATMLDLAFTRLGLHRVTAAIGPGNIASVAAVRRLGFTGEGRLRDHVFTNGAWRDSLLYSILAPEWTPQQR